MNTYEQNSKKKLIATFLTIAVIAGVIVFADIARSQNTTASTSQGSALTITTPTSTDTATASTTASTAATDTTTASTTTASSGYKDGSYTATASYYVPHGNESIDVSLTISDGTVTDVSIQNSEGDRESIAYQEDFAAAYKSYVVGKKISGLQISTVAGASDTTQGFNDAISLISTKAQA